MSRPFFFLDFIHLFNTITLHHGQELPTLLTILTVDVKSGRFRYQSRRAGDSVILCLSLISFDTRVQI